MDMDRRTRMPGDLAEGLGLPGEALGKLKISVVGRGRALIEGHRGLLLCTQEQICLRGERGRVDLRGRELCIEAMREDTMLVRGELDCVAWGD